MLLLLLVLFATVETGRGQVDGHYGQCLTNHDKPQFSDPNNVRKDQQHSRLEFSIALLKKVARQQPSENVFISPLSIYNSLLIVYFTSAGHTEKSLRNILSLPPNEPFGWILSYHWMIRKGINKTSWPKGPKDEGKDKTDMLKAYSIHKFNLAIGRYRSQVHSANRLFVSVNQTIKDCMAEIFFDEIEMVDFSSKGLAKAIDSINDWVSSHTNKKIQNLVTPDSVSPDSQIVLGNVAYFKGTWKKQFDPIDTKMGTFYISKNKTARVPMMFQLNTFNHWRSDRIGAELLELPYLGPSEEKSDLSLILLLPDKSDSLNPATDLVMRLDYASLLDIVKESSDPRNEDKVEVKLPKFLLETTLELTPILEQMGLGDLFKPSSNLTTLTGGPRIKLSSVVHKAKVNVDEYGTEAAAATVYFTDTRVPGQSFVSDRPFVYLLYDKREESLLFAGVYNYPSQ